MALHFYGGLGFLQEHSWLWSSSFPSPQAVSSQPTAVLSPGLLSKPHVPAPRPCLHWQTHVSSWDMQSCDLDPLCRSHSVLPATDWLLHSPLRSQSSPSVPADLPAGEGASPDAGTCSLLQLPPRGVGPVLLPLLSFFPSSFFHLTWLCGIFLVFLDVQGPLLMFSRFSVIIVPFVDVFLMHLWGKLNSTSCHSSAILTPQLFYFKSRTYE